MMVEGPAGPVVVVPPAVCARLERAVVEAADATRGLGLEVDPSTARVIDDIRAVADWWRASVAVDQPAEARPESGPMSVNEAAAVLGVTPHRIRQRLRDRTLAGERRNGRWHVGRAAVEGDHP